MLHLQKSPFEVAVDVLQVIRERCCDRFMILKRLEDVLVREFPAERKNDIFSNHLLESGMLLNFWISLDLLTYRQSLMLLKPLARWIEPSFRLNVRQLQPGAVERHCRCQSLPEKFRLRRLRFSFQ